MQLAWNMGYSSQLLINLLVLFCWHKVVGRGMDGFNCNITDWVLEVYTSSI